MSPAKRAKVRLIRLTLMFVLILVFSSALPCASAIDMNLRPVEQSQFREPSRLHLFRQDSLISTGLRADGGAHRLANRDSRIGSGFSCSLSPSLATESAMVEIDVGQTWEELNGSDLALLCRTELIELSFELLEE